MPKTQIREHKDIQQQDNVYGRTGMGLNGSAKAWRPKIQFMRQRSENMKRQLMALTLIETWEQRLRCANAHTTKKQ